MRTKPIPSQDLLIAILHYDGSSGKLHWLERPAWTFTSAHRCSAEKKANCFNLQFAGKEAFITKNAKGYFNGYINGVPYLAHRVIWKMVTGSDPEFIDHEDGNPQNNRIENMRSVSLSENSRHIGVTKANTSGVMGVHWHSRNKTWTANIHSKGRLKHLGTFKTKEEATHSRIQAERSLGYHPNHGKRRALSR